MSGDFAFWGLVLPLSVSIGGALIAFIVAVSLTRTKAKENFDRIERMETRISALERTATTESKCERQRDRLSIDLANRVELLLAPTARELGALRRSLEPVLGDVRAHDAEALNTRETIGDLRRKIEDIDGRTRTMEVEHKLHHG